MIQVEVRVCHKSINLLGILSEAFISKTYSMLEMQAILVEFLESLEFSPPPGNIEILRCAMGIMAPM